MSNILTVDDFDDEFYLKCKMTMNETIFERVFGEGVDNVAKGISANGIFVPFQRPHRASNGLLFYKGVTYVRFKYLNRFVLLTGLDKLSCIYYDDNAYKDLQNIANGKPFSGYCGRDSYFYGNYNYV